MEFYPGSLDLNKKIGDSEIFKQLKIVLKDVFGDCGYKFPSVSVSQLNEIPSFIIISRKGIFIIDVIDEEISDIDNEFWLLKNGDDIYSRDIILDKFKRHVETRLKEEIKLYNRRTEKLVLNVNKLLIFFRNTEKQIDEFKDKTDIFNEYICYTLDNITENLEKYFTKFNDSEELDIETYNTANTALWISSELEKNRKKPKTKDLKTKNDFISKSLEFTFKLDETQKKIGIQLPDGPQRIRGLAGTGKTVILCMKAALTHRFNSDFKILFIFNTKSMYNQIKERISSYYISEAKKEPKWENIHILHAWGGTKKDGLYSQICDQYGLKKKTYTEVLSQIRREPPRLKQDPLSIIYSDILKSIKDRITPIYDMVLIDEAQDFPQSFFETIYYLTKEHKRIVWAYDEFQSLNGLRIKEPEDLFGVKPDGSPNMPNNSLSGAYGAGIEKDFILPNSYRNPRINLMMAHGLGLGLYREGGIIDILGDKKSWEAIGYKALKPENKSVYSEADNILIERLPENSKNILENLILENKRNDLNLVQLKSFSTTDEEIDYVCNEIKKLNILDDNVPVEEILVITLDTKNSELHLKKIRQQLDTYNIKSIMPGYVEDASLFKEKGFITLTTAYRAKGNEANIVFVINSQVAVTDLTFRARNALFVSITRARGWCFITGSGGHMNQLNEEYKKIRSNYPTFNFIYPKEEDLQRRRVILEKNDFEIEKQEEQINHILENNTELLLEKIKNNPELLNKLKGIL